MTWFLAWQRAARSAKSETHRVMRIKIIITTITAGAVLTLCSCSTAGYYTGRTLQKTGHVISHGGDEVEDHTQ